MRTLLSILIGTVFLYAITAFISWNPAWINQIPTIEPETRGAIFFQWVFLCMGVRLLLSLGKVNI